MKFFFPKHLKIPLKKKRIIDYNYKGNKMVSTDLQAYIFKRIFLSTPKTLQK